MKRGFLVLTAFLTGGFLLITAARAGDQENDPWDGTVKKVGAVTHVINPEYPWKGKIELEFEDSWKIDGDNDPSRKFSRHVSVAVDGQDNVYVLDNDKYLIYKFDPQAKLLLKIPIRRLSVDSPGGNMNMVLDSHGNIWISRMNGTFFKLSPEGDEVFSRTFSAAPSEFGVTADDNLIIKGDHRSDEGLESGVVRLNPVTRKSELIASIKAEKKTFRKIDHESGKINMVLYHEYQFKDVFHSGITIPGVFGFSKEYRISVLDPSGKIAFIIEKEEPAQPVTQEEKDRIYEIHEKAVMNHGFTKEDIRKLLNLPDAKPYFSDFLTDDLGNIYVVRKLSLRVNEPVAMDIFDKEGRFTFTTVFPVLPSVIRNGFFYEIGHEIGAKNCFVRKRSIVNWKELGGDHAVGRAVPERN